MRWLLPVFGGVLFLAAVSSTVNWIGMAGASVGPPLHHPVPSLPARSSAAPSYRTHVSCGEVLVTSTTLANSLYCPGGDGLLTSNAGVTINLAGHFLLGNGAGTGIRTLFDYGGVTIENGTVAGFEDGVGLFGIGAYTVTNMNLIGNASDGLIIDGDSDVVANNHVSFSGLYGITTGDGTDDAVYSRNIVSHNGGSGIFTYVSTSRFYYNVATWNGGDGIDSYDIAWSFAPGYHYGGNIADHNSNIGIALEITDPYHNPLPVVDEGGNEARFNRSSLQCSVLGLTCLPGP